jgi:hypothetical protein
LPNVLRRNADERKTPLLDRIGKILDGFRDHARHTTQPEGQFSKPVLSLRRFQLRVGVGHKSQFIASEQFFTFSKCDEKGIVLRIE